MSFATTTNLIGLSTGALYPEYLTEDAITVAGELGYPVAEVHLQSHGEYDPHFLEQLKARLLSSGVTVHSIHCHTKDFDLWAPYPRRAAEMRDDFFRLIDASAKLGAHAITWHGLWRNVKHPDRVQYFADGAQGLAEHAQDQGVILTVENVSWCFMRHIADIEQVRALGLPLGFTFDPFQAAEAGESPAEVIRAMGEDLVTVHLSDYSTGQNRHLPMGEGSLNWNEIFSTLREIRYAGPVIVESPYRGDVSSLAAAREFVAQHLDGLPVQI